MKIEVGKTYKFKILGNIGSYINVYNKDYDVYISLIEVHSNNVFLVGKFVAVKIIRITTNVNKNMYFLRVDEENIMISDD
jgi:membrane protein DedA with SNARE-associated domain